MNRELEIRERVAQYGLALYGTDRAAIDMARGNLEFYAYSDLRHLLDETARLTADLAAMTAERDAAVRDMWAMRSCWSCMHKPEGYPSPHGACKDCDDEDKWEWRGPVAGKEGSP